jgi:hypothetical protein
VRGESAFGAGDSSDVDQSLAHVIDDAHARVRRDGDEAVRMPSPAGWTTIFAL